VTLFCLPNQSQSDRRFLDTLFRDLDALSVSDLVEFLHNVPQPARVSRNGKPGRSACTGGRPASVAWRIRYCSPRRANSRSDAVMSAWATPRRSSPEGDDDGEWNDGHLIRRLPQ
jgi:hypothetical protein